MKKPHTYTHANESNGKCEYIKCFILKNGKKKTSPFYFDDSVCSAVLFDRQHFFSSYLQDIKSYLSETNSTCLCMRLDKLSLKLAFVKIFIV